MNHAFVRCFFTIIACFSVCLAYCQPGTTIELNKPKQYQNRTLTSEKTGEKKFRKPRRFFQNMITHYNYYFNANYRLNDIIERAKLLNKDDYTKLLNFYDYSIDATAKDADMDSVVYKCNAGILLHDLRNDWVDNLYLTMGQAYFYRKNFDSAANVFQYIIHAFSPREDENYYTPVGSNTSNNNGVFSISTKEDRNLWQRVTSLPPSRNDAMLWQAKVYTEAAHYTEAAGMLEVLRNDPFFPARLQQQLHEAFAYWFYKQQLYDSAAAQLGQCIPIAGDRQAKARREFLTAQMHLLAKNDSAAIYWYNQAAEHSVDPVMEVYANLNSINAYAYKTDELLQQKINNLLKLAHKDRYANYRDIIYFALAQIVLQKKDYPATKTYLQKSIASVVNNPQQKSLSFMMLADVLYDTRDFIAANNAYDSVAASYLATEDDKTRLKLRVAALKTIARNLLDIRAQDSLQTIAKLPKAQQDAVIKKVLRQLRKLQGLKEDESNSNYVNPAIRQNNAPDLFAAANSNGAEWYFNNQALKGQGFNAFRAQWGNRPNVDNWRRQAAVERALAQAKQKPDPVADSIAKAQAAYDAADSNASSSAGALYKNLPVTPEKLKASNEKISKSFYTVADEFQDKLDDYPVAIDFYDSLNRRLPGSNYEEQALYNLYYCYNKTGKRQAADSVKALLSSKYGKGKFNGLLQKSPAPALIATDPATKKYDEIYKLFISGNFEQAEQQKAKADSLYGKSHWTPQLLFIEAIYYVSKRQDSAAINRLNSLADVYPASPMAERAKTMASVLRRRKEIESYLTSLDIKRYEEDETPMPVTTAPNEAVVQYKAPAKPDSMVAKPTIQIAKATVLDTARTALTLNKTYEFLAADTQYVSILLDSVAPVFAGEAANAFNRFNATNNFNLHIKASQLKLDNRYNILLVGPFKDAAAALDYVNKTRPVTATRIIPWLTADRYTYSMISNANLEVLKQTKDLAGYKALLQKVLPGKF